MRKTCAVSGREFEVTDADLKFYEKMGVPSPTLCPAERRRRRFAWRNERTLYRRKCDGTGQSIVSVYPADVPFPVYKNTHWWGDSWDGVTYGRTYDFSRKFFEQLAELQQVVPQLAMMNDHGTKSENCEYCQDFSNGKDCYLMTGSWFIRDSMYSADCNHAVEVVDCTSVNLECELVYGSVNSQRLYHCAFLEDSENCSDCWFGIDLRGCKNCFGCVGLRQQQYHIFNEPHTREQYLEKMSQFDSGSYQQLENMHKYFAEWSKKFPRKHAHLIQCEKSIGNHLYHCKNVSGFESYNAQDCQFVDRVDAGEWSYDIINTGRPKWCCDCVTPDESWMVVYSTWCWRCKNMACCDNCHGCEDCFGCVGLRRKKFCILNQQYSESEYRELRAKIVGKMTEDGEWGEMLPIELSPFAYNETQAQEHFPLTREEVAARGWRWRDEADISQESGIVIPDNIRDIGDDWLTQVLVCEATGKKFKLQPQELKFYRKMNLPIPRLCPRERHLLRLVRSGRWELYDRTCGKCGVGFQTEFSPDRPEKILCEDCYQRAIG